MESMSTHTLDETKYRALLDEAFPVAIRTAAEYRRLMSTFDRLMLIPDEELSEKEGRLLQLLSVLIEDYENRTVKLPEVSPDAMLRYLLEEKQVKPSDLADILPKSRVSEILSGKRGISKDQAKPRRTLSRPGRFVPSGTLTGSLFTALPRFWWCPQQSTSVELPPYA